MTTKTKHRVAANKEESLLDQRSRVVIEDAPNANCTPENCCCDEYYGSDICLWPDNSQPHKYKIASFPVEPQPHKATFKFDKLSTGLFEPLDCMWGSLGNPITSPFHPDDTLTLLEEWVQLIGLQNRDHGVVLLSEFINGMEPMRQDIRHPASSMPPELDSQCQQHNVVKVLGVRNKECTDDIKPPFRSYRKWHWKLLTREQ